MPDTPRIVVADAAHDSTRFKALLAAAGECLERAPDSAYMYCLRARDIADLTQRPGDPGEVEGWLGYLDEQGGRITGAIEHYRKSLAAAERLKEHRAIATVLNNLAAIYKDQGLIDSALVAHRRSLAINQMLHDSSGIATSLNNIGLILYDQVRIPEAMEHYSSALRIYEGIHDPEGTATVLHNIAGIYRDQGDGAQALGYFMRALEIEEQRNDAYSSASTEDNIGGVLERDGRIDQALEHYERALNLHDRANDPRGMGYSLRNIAGIELKRGEPDSALAHATKSLAHFTSSEDKRGQTSALLMQGLALEALGERGSALAKGLKTLAMARELGHPALMRDAAQLLGRVHRADGNWKEALRMQDLFIAMRDSVLNDDAHRSAIRQQYEYAYEKKEAEMNAEQMKSALLARERSQLEKNRRNIILFIATGILVLAIGLWSRLRFVHRSRAAIQKEKDVSESLLHNILPEEVANELRANGHAEAKQFDQATILFTDFKGFTQLSEKLSANELVGEIDHCFKAFDGIMEKYHIEKIKTIGDAYMAASGLPDPKSSKPADAVLAALDMQEFMTAYKTERETQNRLYFEMRVGLHTGPVIAGIVGVKKFAYDIWGDTVNTASRMESSGEVGQVNISEATYRLVVGSQLSVVGRADGQQTTDNRQQFHFTPRGKVQAKGKGEMEMYFVRRSS